MSVILISLSLSSLAPTAMTDRLVTTGTCYTKIQDVNKKKSTKTKGKKIYVLEGKLTTRYDLNKIKFKLSVLYYYAKSAQHSNVDIHLIMITSVTYYKEFK